MLELVLFVIVTNNTINEAVSFTRDGPGRPSVAGQRRREIVNAFIDLVWEQGHANASIAEVAERAGVHRSAIHHFVGNRAALIAAAIDEVWEQHHQTFVGILGEAPSVEEVVDYFFSEHYIVENAKFDDALGLLVATFSAGDSVTSKVASNYQETIDAFLELLDNNTPEATSAVYQMLCLAEHNAVMQRLGFDEHLSASAQQLSHSLLQPFLRGAA